MCTNTSNDHTKSNEASARKPRSRPSFCQNSARPPSSGAWPKRARHIATQRSERSMPTRRCAPRRSSSAVQRPAPGPISSTCMPGRSQGSIPCSTITARQTACGVHSSPPRDQSCSSFQRRWLSSIEGKGRALHRPGRPLRRSRDGCAQDGHGTAGPRPPPSASSRTARRASILAASRPNRSARPPGPRPPPPTAAARGGACRRRCARPARPRARRRRRGPRAGR